MNLEQGSEILSQEEKKVRPAKLNPSLLRFLGAPRRLLRAIGSYFSMPGPSDEFQEAMDRRSDDNK